MSEPAFEWGPIPRAIFKSMLYFTLLIGWVYPAWLSWYIFLLLFLGLGLRPVLEFTGLARFYINYLNKAEEKRWRKIKQQREQEMERKKRDAKYKGRRAKDPRLPPNW